MKYKIKFAAFTLAIAVMLLNTNIHCMSNDIKNSTERVINQSSSSNTILETNTNATVGFVSYMTKEGIFVTKYYNDSLKKRRRKINSDV